MKISIAMATYNGALYLKDQLQSFVEQTRQPDELIITDDCSTDETETIVREFAKKAPFKVEFYLNSKNLGYCGNFNAALMKTTGDLVFLSDQDDVWFPEKIEHMVNVAKNNPESLVMMNDAALTNAELKLVGLTKLGQIRSAGLSKDSFVMGCCCGVRRELLNLCMPIPASFKSHDNWLVWFADGLDAKVIDETVLQYYRRHESNESQFIVNRITRVTRAQMFMSLVKSRYESDAASRVRIQLEQLQIFVKGIQSARSRSPKIYLDKLQNLERRFQDRIKTTECRIAITKKGILARIFAAGGLFISGGYRDTSGVKSILRDIIG